jgi:hypothetical protein
MDILQVQDRLKNFSQDQLVGEMQSPTGNAPQFLVLSEIMRRKRLQDDYAAQQGKAGSETTVAQEAVAAAGVPQGGIADMARSMAPSTDMTQNTGVQAMASGGTVKKMAEGDVVVRGGMRYVEQADNTYLSEDGTRRLLTPGQDIYRGMGTLSSLFRPHPGGDPVVNAAGDVATATTEAATDITNYLKNLRPTPEENYAPIGVQSFVGDSPFPVQSTMPAPGVIAPPPVAPMEFTEDYDFSGTAGQEVAPVEVPPAETPAVGARTTVANPRGGGITSVIPLAVAPAEDLAEDPMVRLARESAEKAAAERDAAGITQSLKDPKEAAAAAKAARDTTQGTGEQPVGPQPTGPQGGSGSGIAGAASGMTSYEQELMDALARREKAATQDKWLALAQVGLNLMSSDQPTLGGAIGEAGLAGVQAAQGSRDQYEQDRLELTGALEQSRMARAKAVADAAKGAGGGGGLSGIKLSQYLPQLRFAADAASDRVSLLTGGMDPYMAIAMAEENGNPTRAMEIKTAQDDALRANSDYTNFVRSIGGLDGFVPEEDDTTGNVSDE